MLAFQKRATLAGYSLSHGALDVSCVFRRSRLIPLISYGFSCVVWSLVGCQSFVGDVREPTIMPHSAGQGAETNWRRVAEPPNGREMRNATNEIESMQSSLTDERTEVSSALPDSHSTDARTSRDVTTSIDSAPQPTEEIDLSRFEIWDIPSGSATDDLSGTE